MSKLTQEQLAVIRHDGGHALVGAVAGSGKTRTLVERIVSRLRGGADARRILVLMFNRAAMEDFQRRLKEASSSFALPLPKVRTFHAFGLDVCTALQNHGLIPPARLINKEYELRKIMRDVLDQINTTLPAEETFDTSINDTMMDALNVVDSIKNDLIMEDEEARKATPEKWQQVFKLWEHRRTGGNDRFRSFTDLLYDPVFHLTKDEEVALFLKNHYEEILVDEFQDVNTLQVHFLKHIAGTRAKVIAVGDEDQTVYVFRSAKPEFMTHQFEETFPNTTRYTLSASFRYGHNIAILANSTIRHNTARTDKICVSAARHETALAVTMLKEQTGDEVVAALNDWKSKGRRLDECAILVREYSHAILTETALMRSNTPYRLVGAKPFFERREVLAMRASLIIANGCWADIEPEERRHDLIASLLTVPPLYLKRQDLDSLCKMAAASPNPEDVLYQAVSQLRSKIKGFAGERYRTFCNHIDFCKSAGGTAVASQFLTEINKRLDLPTVFVRNESSSSAAREKIQLLNEFTRVAHKGSYSVAEFHKIIEELSAKIGKGGEGDSVLLTSIHRSKGMEFPHVLLPELSDERFPSDPEAIEDERRLFYVALTRAQERLTMLVPYDPQLIEWVSKKHVGFPATDIRASRFVFECNPSLAVLACQAIEGEEPLITESIVGVDPSGLQTRYLQRYERQLETLRENLAAAQDPDLDGAPAVLTLV